MYKILKGFQYRIKHSNDSVLEVERIIGIVTGELLIISKFFGIKQINKKVISLGLIYIHLLHDTLFCYIFNQSIGLM